MVFPRCSWITRNFHEKAGSCQAVFLVVCQLYNQTADQREARLASSLSFLERFLFGYQIRLIADQREAHNAAIPNSQITDSPYFHPHSLWSYCPGASWVSSIGNGCCRLGTELNVSVSSDIVPGACRSHPNSAICSYSPSSGSFLLLPSCVVISQWFVNFTRHPQPMK